MNAWGAARLVSFVAGLVMLVAVVMKLESPAPTIGAIAFTLRPLIEVGPLTGTLGAYLLIMAETVLGAMLVLSPNRMIRGVGAGVYLFFGLVLIARFTGDSAPPCGCLGRLLAPGNTAQAWSDAARNGLFGMALLLTLGQPSMIKPKTIDSGNGTPTRSGSLGFTLIETLVTIAVIITVLAITLPMLARTRSSSAVVKSLSAQKQIVASVEMYGQAYRGYFPHYEPLDGVAGPVRIRGATVMEGYFRAHMGFWLAAVGPDDEALINLAIWPPRTQREATPAEESIGLHYSVYYMTATAAADPAAFTDPIAQSPTLDAALLRGVRWDETTYPDRKGLFLDFSLYMNGKRHQHVVAAFGDGSAAQLASDTPPEPIVPQPAQGPRSIVISTRNGIRGTDR
jgi:type II secretory pathway pseudopilin PulG